MIQKVNGSDLGLPSGEEVINEISFYVGRVYYNYVGLLGRILAETGLDNHLSPGMGHVLFVLFKKDDRIIKEVAESTHLSFSTLTGMLTRMENAGVIERRRDKDDGRAMRVRLTSLGRSLKPRCYSVLDRLNNVLQSGMSNDEIETLKRLQAQMIESMRRDKELEGRDRK